MKSLLLVLFFLRAVKIPTYVSDEQSWLQIVDPLTAMMYAVQVMNFLATLVSRTLKARKGSSDVESSSSGIFYMQPFDKNVERSLLKSFQQQDVSTKNEVLINQ